MDKDKLTTTLFVPIDLKEELDKMKVHHRETYYEVIRRLVERSK